MLHYCLVALVAIFTPLSSTAPTNEVQKGAARTVELTGGDDMKFNLTTIAAKAGEQIHIKMTSKGTLPKIAMAHNFVLLKIGSDPAAFSNAGISARETDFIAPAMKAQVIAQTPLAGPGETVEVTFKVPAKAGSYPYLCSFPGHAVAGMKGMLVVK